MRLKRLFVAVIFFAVIGGFAGSKARSETPKEFIAGADISDFDYFERLGAHYLDQGREQDLLAILAHHHINCIRLRLFTSSDAQARENPYESINNLNYTRAMAIRAKKAGLRWLLDFHYSDSWADSTHQMKPLAWEGLSFPQLEQRLYDYNRESIAAFAKADALPAYVQIGNEILGGMLWPDGAADTPPHWEQLGRLMKTAIRGIHDGAGMATPKIIIHISEGDQWDVIHRYFDQVRAQNVDFDVVGLSYYPNAKSQFSDLQTALNMTAARYHRPVMIVETAFPWTVTRDKKLDQKTILGIPAGPGGQVIFIQKLCQAMQSVPDGNGVGVFWWGTEYEPVGRLDLDGYDNSSLFDHTGNVLPAMETLGRFGLP